jgi:hypothetical protein
MRDLLAEATGEHWAVDRWYAHLLALSQQPLDELEHVLAVLRHDPWVQGEGRGRVTPEHLQRRWSVYVRQKLKPVVSSHRERAGAPPALAELGTGEPCPPELLAKIVPRRRTG